MHTLPAVFFALAMRDVRIAYRRRAELLYPPLFLMLASMLFALALPANARAESAPAVIWVIALLASLMALETMRRRDYARGLLEQLLLSPQPTAVLVLASALAHWLVAGLPLVAVAPLLALMLNLPPHAWPELLIGLLLGTPTLCLIGGLGVALTRTARARGALLAVIILPLYIPILIFGSGAVRMAMAGFDAGAQLLLLGALLLLALGLAPMAIAYALRATYE